MDINKEIGENYKKGILLNNTMLNYTNNIEYTNDKDEIARLDRIKQMNNLSGDARRLLILNYLNPLDNEHKQRFATETEKPHSIEISDTNSTNNSKEIEKYQNQTKIKLLNFGFPIKKVNDYLKNPTTLDTIANYIDSNYSSDSICEQLIQNMFENLN
jgi:hypothetical protein